MLSWIVSQIFEKETNWDDWLNKVGQNKLKTLYIIVQCTLTSLGLGKINIVLADGSECNKMSLRNYFWKKTLVKVIGQINPLQKYVVCMMQYAYCKNVW